jgi:hypothetical protein
MIAVTGIAISILALAVSAATAWMTLFRRGQSLFVINLDVAQDTATALR